MTSEWYTKEDDLRPNDYQVVLCRYTDRDMRKSWTEYAICSYYKEEDMFMPVDLDEFDLDIDISLHFDFMWTYLDDEGDETPLKTRPKSKFRR